MCNLILTVIISDGDHSGVWCAYCEGRVYRARIQADREGMVSLHTHILIYSNCNASWHQWTQWKASIRICGAKIGVQHYKE